jgi:hypothetical protein
VSGKDDVDTPARGWTRPDAYIGALARKRTFRKSQGEKRRTQPETPRMLLSTLPFLALLGLLGILAVAIMVIAFPGNQPPLKPHQAAAREQGRAERGWFQEAQKQFHK